MFNRELAVNYAKKWALDFNPNYYDFSKLGGDCTNYISQCLYAGGIPMRYSVNGWFYTSLNKRAPAWTGVDEFWSFASTNEGVGVRLKSCLLQEVELADIIQLYNGERYYHTLIVTDVSNGIRVCSHDYPSLDAPLNNYNYYSIRCGKILN